MKKVLVLGGGGFLGKNICNQLIKKKYLVTIFQRKRPVNLISKLKFKSIDLTNKSICLKQIKNFDYVINSATILKGNNQKKIFLDNFKIFYYPFISCIQNKIKNYIFISSNNVVDNNNFIKITSNRRYINILNGYTLSKIFSEIFINQYLKKQNKIIIKIIRPSNLYGSGQNSGAIYYILKKLIFSKGKIVKLNLNPYSLRNFSHVEDCANCIIKLIKIKKNIVCNISNDKIYEIKKIAEICRHILNKNIQIKYNNKKNFSKKLFKTNNLRRILKWKDKYNLTTGIKQRLNDFKINK